MVPTIQSTRRIKPRLHRSPSGEKKERRELRRSLVSSSWLGVCGGRLEAERQSGGRVLEQVDRQRGCQRAALLSEDEGAARVVGRQAERRIQRVPLGNPGAAALEAGEGPVGGRP